MSYFLVTLLSIFLMLIETSLLPYFQIFGAVPFLFLTFLTLLSVKYQGTFHIFLAFLVGVFFDAISTGLPGLFTIIFISNVLFGRTFFYKDTGYNSNQSFYILLISTTVLVYVAEAVGLVLKNIFIWKDFTFIAISGLILTMILGFLAVRFCEPIVDWMNKKSEERFR